MSRILLALMLAVCASPAVEARPAAVKRTPRAQNQKKRPRPPRAARCRDIFCNAQVLRIDNSAAEAKGLTEEQVESVVTAQRRRLEPCLVAARRRDPTVKAARLEFVLSGAGRVLAVRVDGKRYSSLARCLGRQMSGVRFPAFGRPRLVAGVTLAVPQ